MGSVDALTQHTESELKLEGSVCLESSVNDQSPNHEDLERNEYPNVTQSHVNLGSLSIHLK